MNGWIDTHCHLDAEEFLTDWAGVIKRAQDVGVERFIVPGISGAVNDLGWPTKIVKLAWGFHPFSCEGLCDTAISAAWARRPYEPVAIGECGLDVHSKVSMDRQMEAFTAQAAIAEKAGLPLLVHLRGAWLKALEILKSTAPAIPWIMHAFSGSQETAKLFLKEHAIISFAGSLCMPQARKTPTVARLVSNNSFVLETDAPDLKPFFFKSEYNEPAALPGIGSYLATLRNVSVEEIRDCAAETCKRIFSF